jgi:predicted nuclease of predicted toxin-antitoxin system
VKFLIDMPLSPVLSHWLAEIGHDAVHASAIGLHAASDVEIIDRARQEGRTIVTADLDYPRLIATAGSDSPSLILFRGGDWAEASVRARLAQVLSALTEDEVQGSIITIDRDRVRRRRLPIG